MWQEMFWGGYAYRIKAILKKGKSKNDANHLSKAAQAN